MRFQLGNPLFDPKTGRWQVVVEAYVGTVGAEQLYATQTGVCWFGSEDAAHESGLGAMQSFGETGRLPKIF